MVATEICVFQTVLKLSAKYKLYNCRNCTQRPPAVLRRYMIINGLGTRLLSKRSRSEASEPGNGGKTRVIKCSSVDGCQDFFNQKSCYKIRVSSPSIRSLALSGSPQLFCTLFLRLAIPMESNVVWLLLLTAVVAQCQRKLLVRYHSY